MGSFTDVIPEELSGSQGFATAQVWLGAGPFESRIVPLPVVKDGDVLVAISLATVCGSDRHTVAGRREAPAPGILGHEAVGEIVAIGAGGAAGIDGTPLAIGDRVVWSVVRSCGTCDRCGSGRMAKCRAASKVGHEKLAGPWALSGCYASHIHLPAGSRIATLPRSMPDKVAAPAGCATATVMAAGEAAGPMSGRRVLVIGAGMLGITAAALAADQQAAEIIVSDPDPRRLRLAERFGATSTVPADHGTLPDSVDIALDFSGSSAALEGLVDRLDTGGRLVLIGSVAPGPNIRIDPERIVRRWLTVTGVHNYEPKHLVAAVDLLARTERLPWADLVSSVRPLDEINRILFAEPGEVSQPRMAVRP
ncbi:zinc-binding dehydrogenase [Saxibacter everestensis]|uniref:Zinc-binding dehydrogenase n=1 Tax=Saxibacter everestensis TaxID=2909229 RepID=A0ABY8QY20_9MICO|nr:zinc-binding dehydrogenase [Brevibacteriaceae bacterium ZFBP1038]